jgi:hypothetical protein
LAALVAGVVGLAAGFGLGGLMLIYGALIIFLMRQNPGGLGQFFLINAIGFAAHAVGLAVWLWNWNRIRRLEAVHRRMLVIVCWAMPIAFIVLFARYIR